MFWFSTDDIESRITGTLVTNMLDGLSEWRKKRGQAGNATHKTPLRDEYCK